MQNLMADIDEKVKEDGSKHEPYADMYVPDSYEGMDVNKDNGDEAQSRCKSELPPPEWAGMKRLMIIWYLTAYGKKSDQVIDLDQYSLLDDGPSPGFNLEPLPPHLNKVLEEMFAIQYPEYKDTIM